MSATTLLEVITIAPVAKHTATVIFVHGLGDSGHGWKPIGDMFHQDPTLAQIKWGFPHAPSIPITFKSGQSMPRWFDLFEPGLPGFKWDEMDKVEDEKGMLKSRRALDALITAEVDAGTPASRIVLGGFSQGAAMTALTGLSSERKLAGLAILSGWTPIRNTLKQMLSAHYKSLPIFWGHGTDDPLVEVGAASRDWLHAAGVADAPAGEPGLSFNAYEGITHSTSPQELDDLKAFLIKVLPAEE